MEFQIDRRTRPAGGWVVFIPGGALVLLGILILMMPQLLVALVAGGLILIGSILLSIAWRFRSAGSKSMSAMFQDRFTR